MRVIHHDGRVGTIQCRWGSYFTRVVFDGEGYESLPRTCDIRPLGPIEEELRNPDVEQIRIEQDRLLVPSRPEGFAELWADCYNSMEGRSVEEVDSEALEACARIWEQHGVAP